MTTYTKELSWVVWDEWKDSKQRMWARDWNNHWKTLIKSVPLTWLNNFPDLHWWKLTHTYTTDQRLFCSCADQYWRFCASVPPWAPLHIPDWIPALLLPVGRTDRQTCSLRAGSIPQPVHRCHRRGWAAQRGGLQNLHRSSQKHSDPKDPTPVLSNFLNILESSRSAKREKYELVGKVVCRICNRIKRVKSKKWANLLWMHCKSDTAALKQYKNLIK